MAQARLGLLMGLPCFLGPHCPASADSPGPSVHVPFVLRGWGLAGLEAEKGREASLLRQLTDEEPGCTKVTL